MRGCLDLFACVLCILLVIVQLGLIDFYYISVLKDKVWYAWLGADSLVIIILIWLIVLAIRSNQQHMEEVSSAGISHPKWSIPYELHVLHIDFFNKHASNGVSYFTKLANIFRCPGQICLDRMVRLFGCTRRQDCGLLSPLPWSGMKSSVVIKLTVAI